VLLHFDDEVASVRTLDLQGFIDRWEGIGIFRRGELYVHDRTYDL
jgi:hypothetical protein